VEDHHCEVDELLTTSQEIVTLCSDLYDASPIVQLAADLSQQFESRKQTARRRLDDLEAFFRQIFTDVSVSSCRLSLALTKGEGMYPVLAVADSGVDDPPINWMHFKQVKILHKNALFLHKTLKKNSDLILCPSAFFSNQNLCICHWVLAIALLT